MIPTVKLNAGDSILISRTDRLGDLILCLPLVETIKQRYPECRVDVIASLYASPILENNPHIDGILRVQNDQLAVSRNYRKELERKVRRAEYQVVVVVYPDRLISRLFYRVAIPNRIGTGRRFQSVFFNHRLMHSRKSNRKHEYQYNLDFLRYFEDGPTVEVPRVYLTEKEMRNADRILANAGISKDFVVIHPGSGGSAERWPMNRFIDLYRLLESRGREVLVTGSESEGAVFLPLAERAGVRLKEITGETDLRTLGAILARARTVVANSTGPLHLAAAVGTPVLGLYPSRKIMSPRRWGPVGAGHKVIQPSTRDCQCPQKQCTCMETITVEEVARAVGRVYDSAGFSKAKN